MLENTEGTIQRN